MIKYQFYGRVKDLTLNTETKDGKYTCSFEVESTVRYDNKDYGIAFITKEEQNIPNINEVLDPFTIDNKDVFDFISAHGNDRLHIVYDDSNKIIEVGVCNEY